MSFFFPFFFSFLFFNSRSERCIPRTTTLLTWKSYHLSKWNGDNQQNIVLISLYNTAVPKSNNWSFLIPIDLFPIFVFRRGSVVAEFKLIFKTELEDEKALVPLKKGVEDGKIGSLSVDPDSLKVMNDIEGECTCSYLEQESIN